MRLMTTREACAELWELLPDYCASTTHWEPGQVERIHFLMDYIESRQPVDLDFEAEARAGRLY